MGKSNGSVTFDWAQHESASAAVIRAAATITGSDPTEIEPLYVAVDPDALDALFTSADHLDRAGPSTKFTYAGCRVRLDSEGRGRITVEA